MTKFDAKDIQDKRFWFVYFLIGWAAALQRHMMWLQRQDSFKQKFANGDEQEYLSQS
ncbi:uncharacterized protein LOC111295434 [Durio zibethinus]|uniref:Uncharacterized protein LOC111295434 n=1 Tax=Durio zibethinus TaxID=66656 RepID=A0A6P5YWK8_DURZI|nr:uncharacterized protein LOC111295434 [Durio zibethinus]